MQKVSPGQSLKIAASTFNTMLDAANDYRQRSLSRGAGTLPSDSRNGIVIVRNMSGANRGRFSVLGVSGVLVAPTQNAQEFASRWALDAIVPGVEHSGKLVVLQEPIKAGAMGRALMIGITPVYLTRPSGDTSELAGVVDSQTYLETGSAGAQILWEDSGGTTPHLALVRMPAYVDDPPQIWRMRVVAVAGDYLICQRWNGSGWGGNENVAKPYLLRTSITSRNGITYTYSNFYTRTATMGSDTETEIIVPSYYTSGDEIFAAEVPYTGVTAGSAELTLLDINADGRAWASHS